MLGAIVFGIPSGFIGYHTGLDNIAPIGACVGALAFLSWKIRHDRKKNAM